MVFCAFRPVAQAKLGRVENRMYVYPHNKADLGRATAACLPKVMGGRITCNSNSRLHVAYSTVHVSPPFRRLTFC